MSIQSECWEWKGTRRQDGYGVKNFRGRVVRLHRLAWEWANGLIPAGMCVLHRCDNPPCVNPGHLFLGTRNDNNVDMTFKGRHGQSQKTHCPVGHPYAGGNLRIWTRPDGGINRRCFACDLERKRATRRTEVVRYSPFEPPITRQVEIDDPDAEGERDWQDAADFGERS